MPLFIVSGPSGAGKSTVTKAVAARHPADVLLSVSMTTRPPRPDEENGRDYFFVSTPEFEAAIANGELLEWASVHGARYGTPRGAVSSAMAGGKDVLLEIDVQGARAVKRDMPEAVAIFLEPPSFEELQSRLRARGTEDPSALKRRLDEALREVAQADEFDVIVVNEDLEATISEVDRILITSRTERTP